jgi:probable HAF family extracellular repeat protein
MPLFSLSKTKLITILLAAFISTLISVWDVNAARYEVVDLGADVRPEAINNAGQVTGEVFFPEGWRAFVWEKGSGLTYLIFPPGAYSTYGCSINDSGQVAGRCGRREPICEIGPYLPGCQITIFQAVLWEGAGYSLIAGDDSAAYDLNNLGQVVGADSSRKAFFWDRDTGLISLGSLWGNLGSVASAVNDAGRVTGMGIVRVDPSHNTTQAFIWEKATGMRDIGTPLNFVGSGAIDINNAGQVVGEFEQGSFFWENGVMTPLGTLGSSSYTSAINNSGEVVGWSFTPYSPSPPYCRAFIWDKDAGIRDLNLFIAVDSGWELLEADGINDLGQIVGWGIYNGEQHGFLLVPAEEEASLEVLDGADFSGGVEIKSNPDELSNTQGTPVTGAAADGVTRLLLRLSAGQSGVVKLSINGTGNPEEDGVLRSVDGFQEGSIITVNTITTDMGEKAFAVYRAPENFVRRGHDEDKESVQRQISISVEFTPPSGAVFQLEKEITLVRPPVILVHGLWSRPEMWNDFIATLSQQINGMIINENIFAVNYLLTNASHFEVNQNVIKEGIEKARDKYKDKAIAMVQADVIGYSMGGLLARIWAGVGAELYKRDDNFHMGDINKFITIDSPHFGSFLADFAMEFVHNMPLRVRNWFLNEARRRGYPLDGGAIEDMMAMSNSIINMNRIDITPASHAVIGDYPVPNGNLLSIEDEALRWVHITLNIFRYNTKPYIITGRSDLVVSVESQAGGLDFPCVSSFNHYHTEAIGGFIIKRAIQLLNSSPADSSYNTGFPAGRWPR